MKPAAPLPPMFEHSQPTIIPCQSCRNAGRRNVTLVDVGRDTRACVICDGP